MYKIVLLQTDFLTDHGYLKVDKSNLDLTNQKVIECVEFVKDLQQKYKKQEITKDDGFSIWYAFVKKLAKELLQALEQEALDNY